MAAQPPQSRFSQEMPTGTEVAAYKKYEDATRAVDVLGEQGFPLNAVTVVGSDLHLVERVVGKLTPARVALSGAGQGLTWGLLIGLFALVLMPEMSALIAIVAVCIGVLGGVFLSVLTWGVRRNRRSFAARSSVVAAQYSILVSQDPHKAFNLLADTPGNVSHAVKQPARLAQAERAAARRERADTPPQFGVRLSDIQGSEGHEKPEGSGAPEQGAATEGTPVQAVDDVREESLQHQDPGHRNSQHGD